MAVERISRTQRDLQRLDGRRGPKATHAVTWGDIDELLAEIAVRSKQSGGKFTKAIGARDGDEGIKFEDILGDLDVEKIESPVIGAPAGLTITSSVNEETGISFIYVDWDDVAGSSGYELGFVIDGGGEFVVPAPTSFFQNSVIAGQTLTVRVRSINKLNVPGPWSATVNHVAQQDSVPPEVPGNVTIDPAFNGFWFKWDKSNAADISRYEVYESASGSPAPSASTNPTFTSASPLFFRGAVGNAVRRYYWIRAVDYSENASDWSTRVDARTLHISEDDLGDEVIVARHLTTGELITLSAQIKDAIISDAKIENLSAAKLIAGTQIANNITVNGQALGTIKDNADNPAARINAASTNILPGKITLTGSATLLNWTASADRTKIDGGRIYTNSIEADSVDTTSLAADSAFITNLTSTGTSFMNQLLVRTANIENGAIKTAKIGDLEVDSAKIANLTVGTNKITGEAVTDSEVEVDTYYSEGSAAGAGGQWKEVLVINPWVNPAGHRLLINISFRSDYQDFSGSDTRWRIQFDNQTIYQENFIPSLAFYDNYYSASILVPNPGSGSKKTALWWYNDQNGMTLRDISLSATRIKK